jgi:hypothetical protein
MLALATFDLKPLFRDPDMFDYPGSWRRAGFEVDGEGTPSSIMVASHPSMKGWLFKRYSSAVSLKEQRDNYRCRVKGAERLREFITAQRLTRLVVPQKHLHELPPKFSRKDVSSYVLVVEQLTLLKPSTSKEQYRALDKDGLRQLCAVLRVFEGLDSGVRNIPFTAGGQIAFIDTERWDERKETPLRHVSKYLSAEQRQFALSVFKGLCVTSGH